MADIAPSLITGTSSHTNGESAPSIESFAYDSGATGSDRCLIVAVGYELGNSGVSGVTYGGQALTLLRNHENTTNTFAYMEGLCVYYLLNPPTGSNTLAVDFIGSGNDYSVSASTFENVNQSTPFGTPVSATNLSSGVVTIDVTTTGTNSSIFVTGVMNGAGNGPYTAVTGTTLLINDAQAVAANLGFCYYTGFRDSIATTGTYNVGATSTQDNQGSINDSLVIGVEVFGTSAGAPTASGGSETSISVTKEGTGYKGGQGGSEVIVNISSEGDGVAVVFGSGGSEDTIGVTAEGGGIKTARSPPSESSVSVSAEGGGSGSSIPVASGGSESTVSISSEGASMKAVSGGSESSLSITPEGVGSKRIQDSSETTVSISQSATGHKIGQDGSEVSTNISSQGDGIKSGENGSESIINVSSEGAGVGRIIPTASGGSESNILASGEGTGVKKTSNGSEGSLIASGEGSGSKSTQGGSESTVRITLGNGRSSQIVTLDSYILTNPTLNSMIDQPINLVSTIITEFNK